MKDCFSCVHRGVCAHKDLLDDIGAFVGHSPAEICLFYTEQKGGTR